jgi:hypothetical protein
MISVILNVYKRPYTLNAQIKAILNQSIGIKGEDIHIWINTPEEGLEQVDKVYYDSLTKNGSGVKIYFCSYNTKFWGRFTIPLMCRTKYIAMFDDDIIPGNKWLENCVNTLETEEERHPHKIAPILGGSGIQVKTKAYRPNNVIGWNGQHSSSTIRVDLVGHAWFFKQEYTTAMWMEKPPSWDNGEDMFFSYIVQKLMGAPTLVPPHPEDDVEMWSNVPARDNDWGYDKNAHSLTQTNHIPLRNKIVADLIDRGWKTVRNIKK